MSAGGSRIAAIPAALVLSFLASTTSVAGAGLDQQLGRNEVRVYSAPFVIEPGVTVADARLVQRLERRGYRRVSTRPGAPGEFFWGHDVFWVFRREHRMAGKRYRAALLGLDLRRDDGRIVGWREPSDPRKLRRAGPWIEPVVLAESLDQPRAARIPVSLEDLPEHVWRSVLAAEDARFFDHVGVDGRSLARALLSNIKAGKVVQGGSTITQQLIKNRDLSPKRSATRKMSEAARAVALEAEYDKQEILEAYLNSIYFGHVNGVALYGVAAASRAFFSKPCEALDPGESAMLAAIIQGPNRLSPVRNPEGVLERQQWVLGRLAELGWAQPASVEEQYRRGMPRLKIDEPAAVGPTHLLSWLGEEVARKAGKRAERGRGFVVETTLDPVLQELSEQAVDSGLRRLRRSHSRLDDGQLAAGLISIDVDTGEILAYVGGDPSRRGDRFDRLRQARRQPGSTIKPLLLLEAFADCGSRDPLYPARRVSNRPLRVDLASGPWEPENPGRNFSGPVAVRQATVESLNVPFVRVARWCGFDETAGRLRRAGLELPDDAPPAFALGAVETTPLRLAEAYTVIAGSGRRMRPTSIRRVSRPSGRKLFQGERSRRRVVDPATAYLVRDILRDAAERGTARGATLEGFSVFGKTGTSSDSKDAWFVGGTRDLLTVVWVGRDDGSRLGVGGAQAAVPIWKAFMAEAAPTRPARPAQRPRDVSERWIHDLTGLLVRERRRDSHPDLFRRGAEPPRRRLLARDEPIRPIE